jgi:Tol biopolymer transport system component
VLAATAGGFVALRQAFDGPNERGVAAELPANGRIVFASDVQDGDRLDVHLFSMEPDISAPMQLTEGHSGNYSPDVSPDGSTIAFTYESYDSGEVGIAIISINGSPPKRLTDPELVASNPTWSPDGTRIAFTGGREQSQRIYVMNADGSDPHPITGEEIFLPEDPEWSPDGSLIAFRGSTTPPVAPEGPSAWDIYTIEPDGQRPANITNSPALESQPAWSPDGGSIAYTYDNLPGEHVLEIVVRRLLDGAETFLTDGPELDSDPVWSPNGRFVVFSRQPVVNGRSDLWRIRSDGTAPRMLMSQGYGPSWQPIPQRTVTPTSVVSPSPIVPGGRDIGLPFRVCAVDPMLADYDGDGLEDAAYIVTEVGPDGCPQSFEDPVRYLVVDVDRDGRVDASRGPLPCESWCYPFAAPDLNGDGIAELLVNEGHVVSPVSAWIGVYGFDGSRIRPILFPNGSNRFKLEEVASIPSYEGAYCYSDGGEQVLSLWKAAMPGSFPSTHQVTERIFVIDVEAFSFTHVDTRSSTETTETLPPSGLNGRVCGVIAAALG